MNYEPVRGVIEKALMLLQTAHLRISEMQDKEYDLGKYQQLSILCGKIKDVVDTLREIQEGVNERLEG